ncbi:hypothetical protein [Sphingomonas rubra]|uniref:Uncharacterized protein n=1 Tax=Sphingomonas rubra TaxID=634430 RepID=A0A1I5UAT1_9SPHN|nr:hypothetical protein [Sphingomonas rubra]SFP92361.1 hypothetical protein SAMN04488241_11122 [Sphingomonas rubra]
MAADRLLIDPTTLLDNVDERRVEFAGDLGDMQQAFAVPYDTLRALSGIDPVTEPVALVRRYADELAVAGAKALARDEDQVMVVIGEADL